MHTENNTQCASVHITLLLGLTAVIDSLVYLTQYFVSPLKRNDQQYAHTPTLLYHAMDPPCTVVQISASSKSCLYRVVTVVSVSAV